MPKNILLIDDEELVLKSLARLLKTQQYEVALANSAAAALEKIKSSDFDLIISDVRMPGVDGIEIIKQIRNYLSQAQKKPVPEILISGYADADKYEEATALDIKEYLFKPFDNVQFLRVVERMLA